MELIILLAITFFVILYRNYKGENVGRFINDQVTVLYDKFAPYSFKKVREKTKELGKEMSPKEYLIQCIFLGSFAGVIAYLYFYSLVTSIIYVVAAILIVPYLSFLRCKRVYSEFIFEQVQVYTSNTIMEFATTQSFVKALEGVRESGLLEDPIAGDVDRVIELAYKNGSIDESVQFFNKLYPFYIVKNMHQLFLQITKEGAQNSADSLEQMQLDIDNLVEGVYRDRIDRASFHKKFLQFGMMLYVLALLVQYLLGKESYIAMLDRWYVQLLLHAILLVNSYFLLSGEKYYNENVGAE
ncbi:MAG: hypothetical protein ILA19_03655 [Bacilli bacterium]|nr:hypothetical protein [Bacilli bacterium]